MDRIMECPTGIMFHPVHDLPKTWKADNLVIVSTREQAESLSSSRLGNRFPVEPDIFPDVTDECKGG